MSEDGESPYIKKGKVCFRLLLSVLSVDMYGYSMASCSYDLVSVAVCVVTVGAWSSAAFTDLAGDRGSDFMDDTLLCILVESTVPPDEVY